MITQKRLKEVLEYNPDTGVFTRKGKVAGTKHYTGYVHIGVGGRVYPAHRLAFLYMTGEFPKHQVDHIDRVRDNNKWSNLRDVTRTQNCLNIQPQGYGVLGVRNVHFRRNRYEVIVMNKGYGCYKTLEEAIAIRDGILKQQNK